jgi:hypothetical protein
LIFRKTSLQTLCSSAKRAAIDGGNAKERCLRDDVLQVPLAGSEKPGFSALNDMDVFLKDVLSNQ